MASGNQRDGLFVVHGHATERFANVPGRRDRIRLAVWPFRIHVDQAHLYGAERILKIAVARVPLVAQPLAFRSPINFFGFPNVRAASAKTECLKAHRFKRHIARENHQVGPGNLAAIFLLGWPEQPARLVKAHVIGPAIQRREALLTCSGAAPAVPDAVRACAVPRHPNEQRPVVPKVRRPPLLRVRHHGMQVLDHGIQVETLKFFDVVKLLAHWIR